MYVFLSVLVTARMWQSEDSESDSVLSCFNVISHTEHVVKWGDNHLYPKPSRWAPIFNLILCLSGSETKSYYVALASPELAA